MLLRAKNILIFLLTSLLIALVCYLITSYIYPANLHCKPNTLFVLFLAFVVLLWLVWHSNSPTNFFIAGLVWGGALSNFFELFINKCVNDYLSFFGLVNFNLADIFICLGILLLIRGLNKV